MEEFATGVIPEFLNYGSEKSFTCFLVGLLFDDAYGKILTIPLKPANTLAKKARVARNQKNSNKNLSLWAKSKLQNSQRDQKDI